MTRTARSLPRVAKINGAGIFKKFVEPFLKSWKKSAGPPRGVYKGALHEMPGMGVLKGFKYTKNSKSARRALRKTFNKSARKDFLKSIDPGDLRRAGLSDADIAKVAQGKVPTGYQVHHTFPIDDGGTNDFSNLVLIKNSPDHQIITNHQRYVAGGLRPGQSVDVEWPTFPPGTAVWPPKGGGAREIPFPTD